MKRCLIKQGTLMGKDRLAAFSDGVIAIIITIMVLELKVPHGSDWTALMAVTPNFVSYVLSFIYLAIYWNMAATRRRTPLRSCQVSDEVGESTR
jgi:uncharacterized membrane protein